MFRSVSRVRAIVWMVCACLAAAGGSAAWGGRVMDCPADTSAMVLISAKSAERAAPLEALDVAPPVRQTAARRDIPEHLAPYVPAAFAEASAPPGTVIPLPATVWTGLVILSALAAFSALRSVRR